MAQAHFTTEIKGLDEVVARLTRMAVKDAPLYARIGLRAGAYLVRREARRRAPVARPRKGKTHPHAGNLRAHIRVWTEKGESGTDLSYLVGVDGAAYYGRFVEFGTSRMAARPFLRPALDNNVPGVVALVAEQVAYGIKKGLK